MDKPKIKYTVEQDKTTEVVWRDPIELENVPCWKVTRVTGGMGWHIGKYRTEKAAQLVAALLSTLSTEELA